MEKPSPAQFQALAHDLEQNRLEVVKLPSRVEGYIRVVVSRNPDWYQRLCGRYPSSAKRSPNKREPDTRIKRRAILRILYRLAAGLESKSCYVEDLARIAKQVQVDDDGPPPF